MIRRTIHFSGRVQGVGFRYTTQSIARDFSVAGYVKNLSDGRVELLVEGEAPEIDRFLAAVQDHMGHHVRDAETTVSPATGEFSDFGVAH